MTERGHEPVWTLSTDELIKMKGGNIKITFIDRTIDIGVLDNLLEASPSNPPHLITAIIFKSDQISLSKIYNIEPYEI